MITIFSGIIMLGILVFVHELGHFCLAKLAGVKVLKFSLGFGPRLVSRKWGETEYMICAVPLGGYVQMLGEGNGEEGEEAQLTPEEMARSFAEKPVLWRTAIVAAGPLMNLSLPFVVMPLAFILGIQMPAFLESPPCVGHVAADTIAQETGFLPGDCITAVGDEEVTTWTETNHAIIANPGETLSFKVVRGSDTLAINMSPEDGGMEGLQSLGILPEQAPVIGSVSPGMPAFKAGLLENDRITEIDGHPVTSWYDLKPLIQSLGESDGTFTVDRDGEIVTVVMKPVSENGSYYVGISPAQDTVFKRFGFAEAVKAGVDKTTELIRLTIVFVQKLFAGQVSTKSIGGPITVVQIAGQAAQTDLASVFTMLAFLSIQLGILNLLPIPILDGGHLFFNLFEIVLRRPLSLRAREIAQQIGLVFLVFLMILAFYNDIVRIFTGFQ